MAGPKALIGAWRGLALAVGSGVVAMGVLLGVGWLQPEPVTGQSDQSEWQHPVSETQVFWPGEPMPRIPAKARETFAEPPASPESASAEVDGGITLDAQGNLVADLELRHLLDYFLAMAGDVSRLPMSLDALTDYLDSLGLSAAVVDEVLEVFNRYLSFQYQADGLAIEEYEAAEMERVFDQLRSLRRSVLGPELAQAFFAEDEARELYLTEARRIQANGHLSPEQRRKHTRALEQLLPEAQQQVRRQATRVINLRQQVAALRAAGGSDAEVFSIRQQQLGVEAATRLAELDQQRSDWSRRVDSYRRDKSRLLANSVLAPGDQAEALRDLRNRYFGVQELKRVEVLEQTLWTDG